MPTGWSKPEIWDAKGARLMLRRAINEAAAARVASTQRRFALKQERLERQRRDVEKAARLLTENSCASDRDAVVQEVLRYYYELGELDRAIGATCLPR